MCFTDSKADKTAFALSESGSSLNRLISGRNRQQITHNEGFPLMSGLLQLKKGSEPLYLTKPYFLWC
jgi:hypothetical protein